MGAPGRVVRGSVGGLGDDASMTTALLVLLALAIGAGVGVLVGRRQSMGADPRELAQLHQELADSRVAAARAEADVAVALTQRDAAVARAEEIEAGRQTMVEQFRLLSHEVAEQQRKSVDTSAQQRMQATEQLLAPVAASLKEFQARLTDVEKERVQIATEHAVPGPDRARRRRGHAPRGGHPGQRPAQAAGARVVGRDHAQERRSAVRHGRALRLRPAGHHAVRRQARSAPTCGSTSPTASTSSSTPRSRSARSSTRPGARTTQQKAQHLLQFARHIRTHVDQLSSKQYWKAAESPEFVVLFLPSEEFFSAALDQMPDLYEYAVKRDVVIATPTTLIGMLRAISYGWKQAALADKAAEVFKLGRELHERLGQMGAKFDKLGRALASSVNAYNETVGTVESRVMVSARRFRDLQVSEGDLAPIQALEAPVRQAQAAGADRAAGPERSAELVEADADGPVVRRRPARRGLESQAPARSLRGIEQRGLRERRLLRPVHGPVLRAARAAVRRPGRGARRAGARRRLRPGRAHRRAGRPLRRRPGRRDRPDARCSSPLPASGCPASTYAQGTAEELPYADDSLRRRARPAGRPLHEGPGPRPGRDGAGHPARRPGRRLRLGPRRRARPAVAVLGRRRRASTRRAERGDASPGSREGDLAAALGEAGLVDVRGGELSVTIGLSSFEDWWAPYEEPAGSVGDYLATRTPEQVGRAPRAAWSRCPRAVRDDGLDLGRLRPGPPSTGAPG